MDALEIEKAHIHGGSMGSFIALDFAARYPEKTDKLLMGAGAVAKCDAMGIHMFRVWQDIASAYGAVSEQLARELLTKAFGRRLLDEMGGRHPPGDAGSAGAQHGYGRVHRRVPSDDRHRRAGRGSQRDGARPGDVRSP